MRRFRVGVLMMALALLVSCGGTRPAEGEEKALAIQRSWREMTACSCHVSLTADYGERVFECEMDVGYDNVTGCDLTLTAPELLAGVKAHIEPEKGATLTYEGVSVETGPLTDEGLSPLEAIPTLYEKLTEGYLAAYDLTEDALTLTFRDYQGEPGEGLEAEAVFDPQTDALLTGRLYWNGAQVMEAQVTDFQMMTGETPKE